ncbi:hypothetical protein SDC9_209689 [bioreactor metagenome]|uniref:DNA-packaging protein n=1 Tax=bioreactor metagenome TaxID=1076179 RepID=A0A645JR20_9ZZZZ
MVAACLADLVLVGISATDETTAAGDPLIVRAVILYAKANFGFDPDAERYQRAYDLLKMSLALSSEHGGDEIV